MNYIYVYCSACGNVYRMDNDTEELTYWDTVTNVSSEIFAVMALLDYNCGCTR